MSREWVDDMKKKPIDKRWVMRCDVRSFGPGKRCSTEGVPSFTQPPLEEYAAAGWFIADKHGDICPRCLAEGMIPTDNPHRVMSLAAVE